MNQNKKTFIISVIIFKIGGIYLYTSNEQVKYITPKEQPKVDCTTDIYKEDCVKRFTDLVAEATVLKSQTSKEVKEAEVADDKADELLEKALANYNTVYGTYE